MTIDAEYTNEAGKTLRFSTSYFKDSLDVLGSVCVGPAASFFIALPKEYRWNLSEYRYLKYKVFTPTADKFVGSQDVFKKMWPRFMNHLWSFGNNSTHGQSYWAPGPDIVPDNKLGTEWVDITVDIGADGSSTYNRVIVINIGAESGVWPSGDMIFYFSNIRISKIP